MRKIERIGEVRKNNQGASMEIIDYVDCHHITIKFEDGVIVNSAYREFRNGNITNYNYPTVLSRYWIGYGDYKQSFNGKTTKQYDSWKHILSRVGCENAYMDCSICPEWYNFQNFAKWYDENYYCVDNEKMEIDKDILIKNNRIYSPDTCIFVPERINTLFIRQSNKNNLIGTFFLNGKYIAQCNTSGFGDKNHVWLGAYSTNVEAFMAYKNYKESYIKVVADIYKDKIPEKLYAAMYNYVIDISD